MSQPDDERDLYDLLGVGRDADAAQISKAWRKRTRRAGPGSPEFTRLNEAAETLLNPDRRAKYDASLPEPEAAASPADERPAEGQRGEVRPEAATAATSESAPSSGAAGPLSRRTLIAMGLPLVALFVCVVLAAVYAIHVHGERSDNAGTESARTNATSAAREAMGVVLAYSYKSMDADLQRDLNYLTPSFAKEFTRNFDLLTQSKGKAKSPIMQTKTIVTVAVKGAAVMDATPTEAHVLVFADQTTVHKAGPRKQACPCVLANRVEVSMVKQHGTWLVNNLQTG